MNQVTETKPMIDKRKAFSAIDIGTTKIVALTGYINEKNELTVLGKGVAVSMGVCRGEVINIESTVLAIKAAVKQAEEEAGFFCKKVVVGIAGKHIHSLQNRAFINRQDVDKEISKEEIAKLQEENRHVNLESDEEIIHAIPQTFRIDNEYEVENPIGMRGRRIEANFHIVVGKGTAIKYIRTAINRAGLEVAELMLEPLASAASTLTFDEKKLGVAIIDIGGGTTDIAIYHDNIVQFTEVIPFGGNAITNDISEGCQILDELAEKLKIDYGYCIQDSSLENEIVSIPGLNGRPAKEISLYTLAGIIQARMEEIIDSALFVIKTSGYAHKLGADIVVTGGGALLKFLPQLLSYKTGKEAKIGTPINYVHYQNYKDFYNPIYATSVGLLMRAAELHKESYVAQSHVEPQVQEPAQQSVASQKIAQQESFDLKKEKPNKLYRMVERFFSSEAYSDTKLTN